MSESSRFSRGVGGYGASFISDLVSKVVQFFRETGELKGDKGDKGDSIIGPKGDKGDSITGPQGPAGTAPENVILEGDPRLTDARTPIAHNQLKATITDFDHTHIGSEITDLISERVGTATGAANGGTSQFTIAHGLGSLPYSCFVEVSSVLGSTIAHSWTYDDTNITVLFASPPLAGTVIFQWRVIA